MKKNKKKKATKQGATLFGEAAKSVKKLSKGKLNTAQLVITGATLGALGVRFLVKQLSKKKASKLAASPALTGDATVAEYNTNSAEEIDS